MRKLNHNIVLLCVLLAGSLLLRDPVPNGLAAEVKGNWKAEWEKTVKAAKGEGEVVVFAWITSGLRNAVAEFRKAYPEIKLIYVPGTGSQLGPRLLAERRAGKYLADLYIGGTTTPVEVLIPAKALDPIRPALILPEVADESSWFGKKFYFADPNGEYVLLFDGTVSSSFIAYNTKLVRREEFQSTWDLLHPKWKGKIVAHDPRRSGGAGGPIRYLYFSSHLGPKFVYRLFNEMDVTFGPDPRQMMDWLATGKYPLYLFPAGSELETAKKQGLPVDEMTHITREGAAMHAGAGAVGLLNRAAHPNAAKVFLNWFLSREGQIAYQKYEDRNSLRTDISKDTLTDKNMVPKEGVDYIFSALPEYRDLNPIRKLITEGLQSSKK